MWATSYCGEMMCSADATICGNRPRCGLSSSFTSSWKVHCSPRSNGGRDSSGLWALTKSFCHMEAIVDARGNPVKDSNGHPLVKTPSSRVELPYTYLMAWYMMHCPSLMTVISVSEAFVPFYSGWRARVGCSITCSTSGRQF